MLGRGPVGQCVRLGVRSTSRTQSALSGSGKSSGDGLAALVRAARRRARGTDEGAVEILKRQAAAHCVIELTLHVGAMPRVGQEHLLERPDLAGMPVNQREKADPEAVVEGQVLQISEEVRL